MSKKKSKIPDEWAEAFEKYEMPTGFDQHIRKMEERGRQQSCSRFSGCTPAPQSMQV